MGTIFRGNKTLYDRILIWNRVRLLHFDWEHLLYFVNVAVFLFLFFSIFAFFYVYLQFCSREIGVAVLISGCRAPRYTYIRRSSLLGKNLWSLPWAQTTQRVLVNRVDRVPATASIIMASMPSQPIEVRNIKTNDGIQMSQSPALSVQAIKTINDQENSGLTPLNTPWSWFLDK